MTLSKKGKNILLLSGLLLIFYSILINILPYDYIAAQTKNPLFLLRDDYDRFLYFEQARAFISGNLYKDGVPLINEPTPYPELAYTYFSALYFLSGANLKTFYWLHSLATIAAHIGLIYFSLKFLKILRRSEYWALFLILPGFLYYSPNRYDVIVAFLTSLSLWLLFQRKIIKSFLILAIAGLFKWYPFLLFPLFLLFLLSQKKKPKKKELIFGLVGFFAIVLVVLSVTFLREGRISFSSSYQWQETRFVGGHSLYSIISAFIGERKIIKLAFFLFQFFLFFAFLFRRFRKINQVKLIRWAAAIIMVFILFSRISSAHWMIWFTPLLILFLPKEKIPILIGYDLLSYVLCPVMDLIFFIWEGKFLSTGGYVGISFTRIVLGFILLINIFKELEKKQGFLSKRLYQGQL